MIGFVGGIICALIYIGLAAEHDWGIGPLLLAAYAPVVLICGIGVGLVLRYTVAFTAMWAMPGALVASVIEFAAGRISFGFAVLAHLLALWAIGQVLARITYGPQPQRTRSRSSRRPSVGTMGPQPELVSDDWEPPAQTEPPQDLDSGDRTRASGRVERYREERRRLGEEWIAQRAAEKERRRQAWLANGGIAPVKGRPKSRPPGAE